MPRVSARTPPLLYPPQFIHSLFTHDLTQRRSNRKMSSSTPQLNQLESPTSVINMNLKKFFVYPIDRKLSYSVTIKTWFFLTFPIQKNNANWRRHSTTTNFSYFWLHFQWIFARYKPKLSLTAVVFSTLWVFGLVELNFICFRIFHRIRHPSKTVTATTDRAALSPGLVEQRKSSLRYEKVCFA